METDERMLGVGTPVQVRNRFVGDFRPGFEVAAVTAAGYVLRRTSDGDVLPVSFTAEEVRPL